MHTFHSSSFEPLRANATKTTLMRGWIQYVTSKGIWMLALNCLGPVGCKVELVLAHGYLIKMAICCVFCSLTLQRAEWEAADEA